jgi:hypothetical protein
MHFEDRQMVLQGLLALVENDKEQRLAEGRSTADVARFAGMPEGRTDAYLKYLASSQVRLLEKLSNGQYRLVHDRLVPAIRLLAGKLLAEATQASLLVDERYRTWERRKNNNLLLTGEELRMVPRNLTQLRLGDYEQEKRGFVAKSRRRRLFYRTLIAATTLLAVTLTGYGWYSSQAAQHRSDLQAWGLPAELYDKQKQLDTLEIETSSPITNLKWLRPGLKRLSLSSISVPNLDDLPQSLQSLSLACPQVRVWGLLPAFLTELNITRSQCTNPVGSKS